MIRERLDGILNAAIRGGEVDLSPLYETPIGRLLSGMRETPQDARYHAEGDVLRHTVCVLNELLCSDDYRAESEEGRTVLFLAALLPDIGKIRCTRVRDGEISSKRHSIVGCEGHSPSRIASIRATAKPSSAPSVVPFARRISPSITRSMPCVSKS